MGKKKKKRGRVFLKPILGGVFQPCSRRLAGIPRLVYCWETLRLKRGNSNLITYDRDLFLRAGSSGPEWYGTVII